MERLPKMENLSSIFSTFVASETPINLKENDNVDYNLDQSNNNEVKGLRKKQKKRKMDEVRD